MSAIDAIPHERVSTPSFPWSLFARVFRALWTHHLSWREMRRTRIRLFELTDSELKDIGLTREVAEREAARSLLACYLNNSR